LLQLLVIDLSVQAADRAYCDLRVAFIPNTGNTDHSQVSFHST
jgi:hypothetical protein